MFEKVQNYEQFAAEVRDRLRVLNEEARRCKIRLGMIDDEVCKTSLTQTELVERHDRLLRAYRLK